MTNIDNWYAEQCGVDLDDLGDYFTDRTCIRWTIKDPRCREIIRERLFKQDYVVKAGKSMWTYSKLHKDYETHKKDFHNGTDEVACLTAIYEGRDE